MHLIARPLGSTCAGGVPANPTCSARVSRCLTDEGCHRVPPPGRALAHGLKLDGDLLQVVVRRGGGDAGGRTDQSVIPCTRRTRRPVHVQGRSAARHRPRLAAASASASTGHLDAPRRGWRGPCGWRPGCRRAGRAADTTRLRAARSPPLVRSAISARSIWATAPSTCSKNMPCGVVVSISIGRYLPTQ